MADRDDADSPRRSGRRPQGDGPLFDLPLTREPRDREPGDRIPEDRIPEDRTPRDREPPPAGEERPASQRPRRSTGDDEDGLPLFPPGGEAPDGAAHPAAGETASAAVGSGAVTADGSDLEDDDEGAPVVAGTVATGPLPAPVGHRLAAALLDGGLLLVAAAGAVVGAHLLGVRWTGDDLAPLALFLLVFSFAYSVIPLAFWGRTPGMVLAGILARGADGGPLTFGQTALRWVGGLVTLGLAGLPLVLALPPLGARSLADRVSGTRTWLPPG